MLQATSYQLPASQKGFAAIIAILATLAIGLIFSSAFLFVTMRNSESLKNETDSTQGYYASEAGMEDAIYRIKYGKNIGASNALTVGSSTATTTITTNGNTKTISAAGNSANAIRKTEATLAISSTQSDFVYGVQIGAGGLVLKQNSVINGSIFSNGDITCSSNCTGTKIIGDAWVAGGVAVAADQSSTAQDADFYAGTTIGPVITSVDTSGDVGQYTSIALGSDGFARISYMDNGNKDLRFARCPNADCTSSVRTAVDTAGEVYEVTSLALDVNNFAHISYYHDGNDDQKFIRCTNADCTVKNTTIIESSGNVGDTSAVKIGSDGFARIAYFRDDDGDVKYARCTNADCTAKNITTVDSSNYVGEWLSLALGSNGFARISYYDDTSDDLKFAQCTNDDCTSKNITTVDSGGSVGKHNSLVLDTNDFARISYFDDSNNDLKYARCTNENCTSKNITTIDSGGSVGEYTSIVLGSDGFARISYYDSSNSALKFVRCTNADCTAKNITTVDNSASVGEYTSIALGSDGFARISYYDATNKDLKFARCTDAVCSPSTNQTDVAQSFIPSSNSLITQVSLYLKKIGNPPDATIRIIKDKNGDPSGSADQITSGTLNATSVGTSYSWIDVGFSSNPTLDSTKTYWIVLDSGNDPSNYWVWGYGSANPYANGRAKYTSDWNASNPTWADVNNNVFSDFAFKVNLGGATTKIDGVLVNGDVHANTILNSQVCGNAYYTTIDSSSLTFLNSPGSPCLTPYTPGTGTISTDPAQVPMSISQANISLWESQALSGGTIAGPYSPANGTTIGPTKINGDLNLTTNGNTYYIGGPVWVVGNINIANNVKVILLPGFGALSTVVIADDPANQSTVGMISVDNGVNICGAAGYNSGSNTCNASNGSYIMFLSTYSGTSGKAIALKNNSDGAIFYASAGSIEVEQTASAKQITGYKVELENNASITYESGLQVVNFSAGPSAGWAISGWKEVQ